MVEAVFAANRHLAKTGPILPEGTPVTIPVAATQITETDEVKLWD
jgi:phage tail protein X